MILLELISGFILKFFVSCLFGEQTGLKAFCAWLAFIYVILIICCFSTLFSGNSGDAPWFWLATDTIFYAIVGALVWYYVAQDKREAKIEARKKLMRKLYFSKN